MFSTPDIAIVDVDGDLDVRSVTRIRAQIDALIARGCRRVVLDLDHSEFVDSAGLGLILSEARTIRSRGGILSLANASAEVMRAMRLACLVDVIPTSERGGRTVPELPSGSVPAWTRSILVDADHMDASRKRFSELLAGLALSADEIFDMTLAFGEAVGNAVDHACPEGVCANVEAYADRVVVEVTDCGCGFQMDGAEELQVGESDERGRGIKLMRMLADSVSILRRPSGTGTVVRLVKLLDE